MTKNTIGTTNIDAKSIYEKLKSMIPGEAVSYQELSNMTGRDIVKHRHILVSARNMALRDSIVFDVIHNFGIKRLTDSEIVKIESVRPLTKVQSALKSGVKRISCAKEITNEERIKQNLSLSIFGAISEFSKPNTVDKLIVKNKSDGVINFQNLLEMFDPKNKLQDSIENNTT